MEHEVKKMEMRMRKEWEQEPDEECGTCASTVDCKCGCHLYHLRLSHFSSFFLFLMHEEHFLHQNDFMHFKSKDHSHGGDVLLSW